MGWRTSEGATCVQPMDSGRAHSGRGVTSMVGAVAPGLLKAPTAALGSLEVGWGEGQSHVRLLSAPRCGEGLAGTLDHRSPGRLQGRREKDSGSWSQV